MNQQQELEVKLAEVINKLNRLENEMLRTRGYTLETKKIRLLNALIQEQIRHENTLSAARSPR